MSENNGKIFIRRKEARERLGVSDEVFTKLVAAKRLKPYYLTKGGRAHYAASQVEALISQPNPQPKKSK
jgi:hypothetical protein